MRKTCDRTGESSQSRSLPRVASTPAWMRISLLSRVLEIKLTSLKSSTRWIGVPSLGRSDGNLFRNLADGSLVEELAVVEANHFDVLDVIDLDSSGRGHGSNPGKEKESSRLRIRFGIVRFTEVRTRVFVGAAGSIRPVRLATAPDASARWLQSHPSCRRP